jgi:hypothetical protein
MIDESIVDDFVTRARQLLLRQLSSDLYRRPRQSRNAEREKKEIETPLRLQREHVTTQIPAPISRHFGDGLTGSTLVSIETHGTGVRNPGMRATTAWNIIEKASGRVEYI